MCQRLQRKMGSKCVVRYDYRGKFLYKSELININKSFIQIVIHKLRLQLIRKIHKKVCKSPGNLQPILRLIQLT